VRPTRDLDKLSSCCQRRARRLRLLVDSYLLPVDAPKDRIIGYVALEAHNLWSSFSRAFYLSCALNARTKSGVRVTVGAVPLSTTHEALLSAIRLIKNPKFSGSTITGYDEPAWHVSSNILKLFQNLQISNVTQVQNALSYPSRYFDLLPKTRNFYAHRCLSTRGVVQHVARELGVSTRLRSSEMLVSKLPTRPQHVLGDWLDDIGQVADLMCQ
jgi:hypothetical protein